MPQEPWLTWRTARRPPRDVDAESLETYARNARLKDEAALWRDAVAVKALIASRLSAGAVSHDGVTDFQRRFEEDFVPALTHGGIGRARDVLEEIRRELRDGRREVGRREDASSSERDDQQSAEIIELMETNGYRAGGSRRGSAAVPSAFDPDNAYSRAGHGGKVGRPRALGTRDAAEAERLVLNYFPGSTIGQVQAWARKRRDTRLQYERVGSMVRQLMDVDRSVTAQALAEALGLKKTALYELRDVGRRSVALAA
jgi:hypothetical protein